jgi:hypothetical protein
MKKVSPKQNNLKKIAGIDTKYLIGAVVGICVYLLGSQVVNALIPEVDMDIPTINRIDVSGDDLPSPTPKTTSTTSTVPKKTETNLCANGKSLRMCTGIKMVYDSKIQRMRPVKTCVTNCVY